MVDPPSGYRYGFPKPYDKEKHPDFNLWLVSEGYPQKEIDSLGENFCCRYWHEEIEAESPEFKKVKEKIMQLSTEDKFVVLERIMASLEKDKNGKQS